MNEKKLPRAFLDTNVLYPLVIRDILLWFAYEELFLPFWSKHVLMEWSHAKEGIDANRIPKKNAHDSGRFSLCNGSRV